LLLLLALLGGLVRRGEAQLLSPGKLSSAHAQLEGMGNCTSCHELGKPGASEAKCLDCHAALKDRIERKAGLHATFTGKSCTSCHKEHFGVQFPVVKLDTVGFDHSRAGYALRFGHLKVTCRSCHRAEYLVDTLVRKYAAEHRVAGRTFLGLGQTCTACHRKDDVHAGQFAGARCNECHTEKTWKDAPGFDHGKTDYTLTGKHLEVRCSECHRPAAMAGFPRPVVRFAGLTARSCTDCHRDPHRGRMKQTCESCHSTDGWSRLLDRNKFEATFDHSRTKFTLRGAHARAACDKCHAMRPATSWTVRLIFAATGGRSAYPAPVAADCMSCHVDVHQNTFVRTAGGPGCQGCHTESGWVPTTYDLARHARETYALTGAHLAVPCADCHPTTAPARVPRFHLGSTECVACHAKRDPHAAQFPGRACSECHTTASFAVTSFNHARTRYPLDGAHQRVACSGCHRKVPGTPQPFVRYRPLETTCRACHGTAIPRPT
jgi:hypothetical protein